MSLRSWVIVAFLIVQLIGVACSWNWQQQASSSVSVALWSVALVLLFPGNFLAAWITETLFWKTGLSLFGMGLLTSLLLVLINGLLWFSVAKVLKSTKFHASKE